MAPFDKFGGDETMMNDTLLQYATHWNIGGLYYTQLYPIIMTIEIIETPILDD